MWYHLGIERPGAEDKCGTTWAPKHLVDNGTKRERAICECNTGFDPEVYPASHEIWLGPFLSNTKAEATTVKDSKNPTSKAEVASEEKWSGRPALFEWLQYLWGWCHWSAFASCVTVTSFFVFVLLYCPNPSLFLRKISCFLLSFSIEHIRIVPQHHNTYSCV